MRHRFSAHGMSIAVAVALAAPALVLGAGPARAQAAAPQAADGWTPPRTLWGDPDLQGQWTTLREAQTPFERPDALAERGITDPRNPEVLAEQQALVDAPEARQAFEAQIDAAGAEGTGAGPVHWYENLAPERSRLWFVVDPPDALGGHELKDDVNCPGPYTIERAADSAGRRSFVRQLERVFNVRSRRPVHDGWELAEGQTPLSLLFQALPRYQRARFNVEAFVQACQQHVLVDGAGHPDFPGYHALNGCFHGPPNVCRCPLPARTGVGAVPMERLDPAQAEHAARAVPHVFNRKT